jgi:disulfide bond formation protein DsbB
MTFLARTWPARAAFVSLLLLAAAHAFETFGHMAPCELCLRQREVYWVALAVGVAGTAGGFTRLGPISQRAANVLLAVIFFAGAAVAGYHAGVEWKWWPGPAACSSQLVGDLAGKLNAFMAGARLRPPACDRPAWVFFGLSMAGWNAVISMGLSAISVMAVSGAKPREDAGRGADDPSIWQRAE